MLRSLISFNFFQQLSYRQNLTLLIIVTTFAHLVFAQTGLGIDETYTVATSRSLNLSEFDHPPLAWWLSWLAQKVFQSDAPLVVRLPFIGLSAVATWQISTLTRYLFGNKAGLLSALAYVCTPTLGIIDGTWVLPDGPLIVGLLGGTLCLARLFFDTQHRPWLWLVTGFWGGVALLSKYHGIFLFIGTVLFIISSKQYRHWIYSVWPYLGITIALIVFSPALIWNFQHHWVSFEFQGERASTSHLHILNPVLTILGQAIFLLPWIWFILIFAALKVLRNWNQDARSWFLLCLSLPQIMIFTLVSMGISSSMLYHWAMPGYLFLFPLLGDYCARKSLKQFNYIIYPAIFTVFTSVILIACISYAWFYPTTVRRLGFVQDPLLDMRSFNEINTYMETDGLFNNNIVVAPLKWHLAGKFDYALGGHFIVTCLNQDSRQYGIISPLEKLGNYNFLIPIPLKDAEKEEQEIAKQFMNIRRLNDLQIHVDNIKLEDFAVFYAQNFIELPRKSRHEAPYLRPLQH